MSSEPLGWAGSHPSMSMTTRDNGPHSSVVAAVWTDIICKIPDMGR